MCAGLMRRCVTVAIVVLLAACGGGGGTGGGTPPVATPAPTPTPTPVPATTPSGSIQVAPSTIALMDLNATQTLTLGDTAPDAAYSVDASRCKGIANATQSSSTTYNVSAVAIGTCNIVVSDNHGNSLAVFVAVTTTSVGIQ